MTRSGRGKKRKLPDGEINDSAITPSTRGTRKDGGARVSIGGVEDEELDQEFEGGDHKIEGVGQQTGRVDQEFEGGDHKIEGEGQQTGRVDQKIEGVDQEIEGVRKEIQGVSKEIEGVVKEIEGVIKEIKAVKQKIEGVDQKIEAVGQQIVEVEKNIETCSDPTEKTRLLTEKGKLEIEKGKLETKDHDLRAERAQLRTKEHDLRAKEHDLRAERAQLRTKEQDLRTPKERLSERVGPVPDKLYQIRPLDARYRQFAPSSMNARNVKRVQIPQFSEQGPLYKCGRPADAAGLEAPLMHPAFGSFVQNLQKPTLPTRDDCAFAREFCEKSLDFYKNEHERQTTLFGLLSIYLRSNVESMKIGNFEVDGYIGRHARFPVYSIIEVENELGSTAVDRFFQGQRYYAELCIAQGRSDSSVIFSSCNCPMFLVEIRGVQMRISAMAYFDRVHTSMLTDLVNISWPSKNLPHIFKSLKLGIASLEDFYTQAEQGETSTRGNWFEKGVPYPIWWNPEYSFKQELLKSSGLEKHIYLAEDSEKRMVVIKFSMRYGDLVHNDWHNAGFAPKLYDVKQLEGGFKMIVMEYLGPPWETLALLDTETKERARVVVKEALQSVQKICVGTVHGDARDVNIMVRPNEEGFDVRFVDFDWAGKEFSSTYPLNMNHTTIAWPEGVADGKLMMQSHDRAVLNLAPGVTSKYNWKKHV